MYLLKKLSWFFKLEKRRYLTGIIALGLVSVFNLIPPRVMGEVIDKIASQVLTPPDLFVHVLYLILSGLAMYGLRYVWRMYIFGTANHLGQILRHRLFEHFTRMSPSFFQRFRTGDLMAHATNDINALVMTAGGGCHVGSGCFSDSHSDPLYHVSCAGLAADLDCHLTPAFYGHGNQCPGPPQPCCL